MKVLRMLIGIMYQWFVTQALKYFLFQSNCSTPTAKTNHVSVLSITLYIVMCVCVCVWFVLQHIIYHLPLTNDVAIL